MIDREKGIWSEFAEEELLNNMPEDDQYDPNGLPRDFTDKYHTDGEDA